MLTSGAVGSARPFRLWGPEGGVRPCEALPAGGSPPTHPGGPIRLKTGPPPHAPGYRVSAEPARQCRLSRASQHSVSCVPGLSSQTRHQSLLCDCVCVNGSLPWRACQTAQSRSLFTICPGRHSHLSVFCVAQHLVCNTASSLLSRHALLVCLRHSVVSPVPGTHRQTSHPNLSPPPPNHFQHRAALNCDQL